MFSENIRVAAVGSAPQAIANHSCFCKTKRKVLRAKKSPDLRRCAEHGKVVGAHFEQFKTFRLLSGVGQIGGARDDNAYFLEDTGSCLQILQLGDREGDVTQTYSRIVESDLHQTTGVVVRQGTQ